MPRVKAEQQRFLFPPCRSFTCLDLRATATPDLSLVSLRQRRHFDHSITWSTWLQVFLCLFNTSSEQASHIDKYRRRARSILEATFPIHAKTSYLVPISDNNIDQLCSCYHDPWIYEILHTHTQTVRFIFSVLLILFVASAKKVADWEGKSGTHSHQKDGTFTSELFRFMQIGVSLYY